MPLYEQLPGGRRVTRPKAREITTVLQPDEQVQEVVNCFRPHPAASTWPLLPFLVILLIVSQSAHLPSGLFNPLWLAAIIVAFGAAVYRYTAYLLVATDRSLLLIRHGKIIDGQRGQLLKRLPRTTRIGKLYLFSAFGLDVRPWIWLPAEHALHLHGGPLYLGLRLDAMSLWTIRGNKRLIKRIDKAVA
jgi:hypothetical protein